MVLGDIDKVWREQMANGGVSGILKYSTKGYVARVAHVAATTLLMKSISTAIMDAYKAVAVKK